MFTSIVNANTKFVSSQVEKRILSHGGRVNKNGITICPRSKGAVQLVGKDYWRTLENFDPVEYIKDLGRKTNLVIFKPLQDEVLQYKHFDAYKKIKGIRYYEVNGDHNFKKPKDRRALFKIVWKFLKTGDIDL